MKGSMKIGDKVHVVTLDRLECLRGTIRSIQSGDDELLRVDVPGGAARGFEDVMAVYADHDTERYDDLPVPTWHYARSCKGPRRTPGGARREGPDGEAS